MTDANATTKPTIVLVHGAWADGSSWSKVIVRLTEAGYPVVAPAIGLLSLTTDIAATRAFIAAIPAPVLVVGHSYGGAVITGAASGLANVGGLVYFSAFAPDAGESLQALNVRFGEQYGPPPAAELFRPDGPFDAEHPGTLVYLDRAGFASVFVQDIDPAEAAVLAAVQRPIGVAAFGEPLTAEPAWRQVPAWYMVAANDRTVRPEGERWMAERMRAVTSELASSHAIPVAQPDECARLIVEAARTLV